MFPAEPSRPEPSRSSLPGRLLRLAAATALWSALVPAPRADQPRHLSSFTSANGRFELRLEADETTWTMRDRTEGATLYTIRRGGALAMQTLLVSDDGRSVIAVNDWPETLVHEGPVLHGELAELLPRVAFLEFFRDGKRVKVYRAAELVRGPCALTYSASHAGWLIEQRPPAFPSGALELTTQDLTTFRFDPRTGALLARDVPDGLDGSLFVYGQLRRPREGVRELEVVTVVLGEAARGDVIRFEVDETDPLANVRPGGEYRSVILRDGKLSPLTRLLGFDLAAGRYDSVMLNSGARCASNPRALEHPR